MDKSKKTPFIQYMPLHEDDRGSVYCVMDSMDVYDIRRTYIVHNWTKGFIRAWHGHEKGWTGIHVIKGAAKVLAKPIGIDGIRANLEPATLVSKVLSDRQPAIMWVPPGYANGTMSLEDNTKILVYSTLSFEEVKQDDVREYLTTEEERHLFKARFR